MATSLFCPDEISVPSLPHSSINLLPFHLKYTGPAPISTYFQPRDIPAPSSLDDIPAHLISDSNKADGPTVKVAAFRGRRVQAYTSQIPEGYIGLLLSAPPIPTSATIDVPDHRAAPSRVATLRHAPIREASQDPSGLRRSPRKRKVGDVSSLIKLLARVVKKKVVAKFSLDSDSEEEEMAGSVVKDEDMEGEVAEPQVEGMHHIDETGGSKEDVALRQIDGSATDTLGDQSTEAGNVEAAKEDPSDETAPISPLTPLTPTEPSTTPPNPDFPSLSASANSSSTNPFLDSSTPSYPSSLFADRLGPSQISSRTLTPTAKFSSFTIWSPDGALDPGRDEYVRALGEWMTLGKALHASDI